MWILKARREEQIKAAHDEAMFGASAAPPSVSSDNEPELDSSEKKSSDGDLATSLFSENVNGFSFWGQFFLFPTTRGTNIKFYTIVSLVSGPCKATRFMAWPLSQSIEYHQQPDVHPPWQWLKRCTDSWYCANLSHVRFGLVPYYHVSWSWWLKACLQAICRRSRLLPLVSYSSLSLSQFQSHFSAIRFGFTMFLHLKTSQTKWMTIVSRRFLFIMYQVLTTQSYLDIV